MAFLCHSAEAMKRKKQRKPRQSQPKSKLSILRQVCDLIPSHLVGKLSRKHGVDKKSRAFSAWSHVVSMLFAQISGAISLNDVCDNLRNHGGILATIRGALVPSRNGLSHANKVRLSTASCGIDDTDTDPGVKQKSSPEHLPFYLHLKIFSLPGRALTNPQNNV